MPFLTNLARKILHKEIADIINSQNIVEDRNIELREEIKEMQNKNQELQREIAKVDCDRNAIQDKYNEIQKENEILRQYYELDKEPSDEIKTKIHIDLEVNRLKEENLKLSASVKLPALIPQPYPVYTPTFGMYWR